MMRFLRIIYLPILCLFLFNASFATNYYVDNTATGNNSGSSWANAWESFADISWSLIQPGDIIYISGGSSSKTYFETLNIGTAGTPGNNVLISKGIDSGHNGEVIIDGSNTRSHGVDFGGSNDYVTVSYLTIRNTTSCCIDMEGVYGGGYGNYTHINPIVGSKVEHCRMFLSNGSGILFRGTSRCSTYKNYFESVTNSSAATDGIFSQASSYNVYDSDSIIIRNQNPNPHCDGIQINQDTSDIVRNCYIEQDNSKESNAQGIYATESFGTLIYYNNVVNLTKSTSNAITHRNLTIGNGKVEIYSNVVFAEQGANHAIWCTEQNTPPIVKNNILRSLSGIFGTIIINGAGTSGVSHNAVSGGSSVGSNVITGNPLFVNELGGIFTLQSNSPCIDAGSNLGSPYNVDKVGTTRPQGNGWDIGAYEFISGGGGVNSPPNQPSNPDPENGATNQQLNMILNWTCTDPDGDPLTYDVYFGSGNNPPLVSTNQSSTSYNPGQLSTNTTYYWKIVAKDNQGHSTTGSIWNFTTVFEDITPPEVTGAVLLDSVTLKISFSEPLEETSAENINNYSITNNIIVNSATLNVSVVTLTTSPHSPGQYTVTVFNVKDLAGNQITSNSNSADYEMDENQTGELLKLNIIDVTASVIPQPDHTPEKTIDGKGYYQGDPDSRWAGDSMPEWIQFDLGSEQLIFLSKLSFYRWNEGRRYNYSILVSSDYNNWTEVLLNVESINEEWTMNEYEGINARYFRIVFNYSNQTTWASLWECEIWGYDQTNSNNGSNTIPSEFSLSQNYPNPFNPTTTIEFSIPHNEKVKLEVFNLTGEKIKTLAEQEFEAGKYSFVFSSSNIPSGTYFYRILTPSFQQTKKMILLR